MKYKLIFFVFGFLAFQSGYAQQSFLTIKGSVLDGNSGAPLGYANVYMKGKSLGLVTNDVGEFEFNLSNDFAADTLMISYVGYESYSNVVSKINIDVFRLKPKVTTLQEIEVQDITAEMIVKNAVNAIDKNYSSQPFLQKAFYRDWKIREFFKPDSSGNSLIEAAVTIFDEGYQRVNNKALKEDVYLDEIRRTKGSGTIYNFIDLVLKQNYIRHNKSKNIGGVTSPFDFKKGLKYDIDRILTLESENVYLVTAVLPSNLGKYEMYINQKDYAVLRINFHGEMAGDSVLAVEPMPWIKKTNQIIFIDNTLVFRKYNGVYYPSYIKLNWRTRTISDIDKKILERREFFLELLSTEIITDDVKTKNTALNYPMSPKTSLEQQIRKYNEPFWDHFNTTRQNPLDTKLKKLVEKDGKLEDQFRNQVADPVPPKHSKASVKRDEAKRREKEKLQEEKEKDN